MAKKKKTDRDIKVIAQNRKALHNYSILEDWEAGIVLVGSEVKSLRKGGARITESHAEERGGEIILVNSYIAEYAQAGRRNHDPNRPRKLLMHAHQINKIAGRVKTEGLTLVPLLLYFNEKGVAKVKVGLGQGKTKYDKREVKKKRDWERQKGRLLREK